MGHATHSKRARKYGVLISHQFLSSPKGLKEPLFYAMCQTIINIIEDIIQMKHSITASSRV